MLPVARSLSPYLLAFAAAVVACSTGDSSRGAGSAELPPAGSDGGLDELPRILNEELPFRYPPELYALKTQADVVLRLYVDSTGAVMAESTAVERSSGAPELDSAAVADAAVLVFAPARHHGQPVGTPVLLPVQFRHPDAPQAPGDSARGGATPSAAGRP